MWLNVFAPHLDLVPGLHFAAVLLSNAFILRSDLIHDDSYVLLRFGIHFHIHRAGTDLVTQRCKLLQVAQQSQGSSKAQRSQKQVKVR